MTQPLFHKFISPQGLFSIQYPINWEEFEDEPDTFLFYDPIDWTGNFRITAYTHLQADHFGETIVKTELESNSKATPIKIGELETAYFTESIKEGDAEYTTHFWITGINQIAFQISFTAPKEQSIVPIEAIIASLQLRTVDQKESLESIKMRLIESIQLIEAFDWVSTKLEKSQKIEFLPHIEEIDSLQKMIDSQIFDPKQRTIWEKIGIAFAFIIENELEGFNWVTVIEGKNELPAMQFKETDLIIYPTNLVWEQIKQTQQVNLKKLFEEIKQVSETNEA